MSDKQLSERLFPSGASKPVYKMPDYAYVHKELQRSGVTLNLLWLEYCDQCRAAGEVPYQSTQFNKYYADYLAKSNATIHLNHKPGEVMQVDWAGDTAAVIDTDTGEVLPAYVFVATLPYSGYSSVEAFFSMNQESWTTAHVNAYKYFIHMLVSTPPKYSVSQIMGYLKGKSSLMIFDRHANLKYKYGNRHFWARGYFVDTVGKNKK